MNKEIRVLDDDDYDLNDDLPERLDWAALRAKAEQDGWEYRGLFSGKLVRLAPDVAEVFDTPEAVNEALRTLIRLTREMKSAA